MGLDKARQDAGAEVKDLRGHLTKVAKCMKDLSHPDVVGPDANLALLERRTLALERRLDEVGASAPLPACRSFADQSRAQIEQLRNARTAAEPRREQLIALAKSDGWPTSWTDRADFVGGFRVEHDGATSRILFGKSTLQKLEYTTGREILDSIQKHRDKLEAGAREGWGSFVDKLSQAQEALAPTSGARWSELCERAIPDKAQRRRLSKVLTYRLAMLISGSAPGDWQASVHPPTLAEQRKATAVPRLDRPNDTVKVSRLRISRG